MDTHPQVESEVYRLKYIPLNEMVTGTVQKKIVNDVNQYEAARHLV